MNARILARRSKTGYAHHQGRAGRSSTELQVVE
jgi:hypothetical protein